MLPDLHAPITVFRAENQAERLGPLYDIAMNDNHSDERRKDIAGYGSFFIYWTISHALRTAVLPHTRCVICAVVLINAHTYLLTPMPIGSQLYATPRAPCDVLYLAPLPIGC